MQCIKPNSAASLLVSLSERASYGVCTVEVHKAYCKYVALIMYKFVHVLLCIYQRIM
jgi:hypothetical protein